MEKLKDFDQFLHELYQKIQQQKPNEQYKTLLKAMEGTECPYLKGKIQLLKG